MIERFLSYLTVEKRSSVHTIEAYRNDLTACDAFMEENRLSKAPNEVDVDDIRGWLISEMSSGISPRTIKRRIAALKSYFKFLEREGVVHVNPTIKIISPKIPKSLPNFFKENELQLLLTSEKCNTFDVLRNRLIIDIFYQTGMRVSELVQLKDADINFIKNEVKIFGKRSKERLVPFGKALRGALLEYMAIRNEQSISQSGFLIVNEQGEQLDRFKIANIVKKELSCVTTQSQISPHVLRHTFATTLLNNGADINAVKELLGHTNLGATEIYTHTTFDQLQHIYKQAHPRAQKRRKYGNQNSID